MVLIPERKPILLLSTSVRGGEGGREGGREKEGETVMRRGGRARGKEEL